MNGRNAIARKRQNELVGADLPDEEPDIRTIEQSELEELPQDAVEHGLPQEERLKICWIRSEILIAIWTTELL